MKKGCFISVIIVLTLLVATTFYIFKFYDEEIKEFGKSKMIEFAESKINNDLDELPNQQFVDTLKIAIGDFLENVEDELLDDGLININKIEEIADNFEVITMDNKIDSAEYKFIIKLLN
ncbi:MAG: hypothetical protein GY936_11960, partial [Ignavibacteriae bacterium]|nr:hypothetical protein [Ignavibacteriota bacterium]